MSPIFYVTLFLALVLCNASVDSGNQFNKGMNSINEAASTNEIRVQINLPPSPRKVHFKCSTGGRFEVTTSGSYKWNAGVGEQCKVRYMKLRSSIVARDSNEGGRLSQWVVQSDGLYHSTDMNTWSKKAEWRRLNQ
ncbi:hypothetical protein TanjilG_20828 [Lupinus angustifolius]|uniref:S-protein homolog n=1 Tax=Lupinus angustifolius TaxID=3871 RepID=A0A4P1QRW2_LUPAN|nr:hypothetical protein TanjilG_20828 [Lupinus angustifolius]